jgi:hypothetical protein
MGEAIIRVQGTGFVDSPLLSCLFGAVAVSAAFQSDDLVECQPPIMPADTEVTVRVANNGVDFSSSFSIFRYQGLYKIKFIALSSIYLSLFLQQML